MFPTGAFNQLSLGYPFPGQQTPSLYQSQFGGVAGFNPQIAPPFQQIPTPRGQSLPAAGRQYPTPTGPYAPPPQPTSSSSRRQQQPNNQYPPPAPSQHYEYRSTHGSRSGNKQSKRRSVSPSTAVEQGIYSDPEQRKENQEQSEGIKDSRSQSPTLASRSKQEVADNDQQQQQQQQQSQVVEGASSDIVQGGVARSEQEQAVGETERRKSGSKKKKHHRRDRYDNYNHSPGQGVPLDINPNNPFQQPYPPSQYPQQPAYFGEYHNELPPQLKVHRQPLYSSYNQAYEESIRRGDVYRKQAKRSTRLPPEVKQKLLPHEDDRRNLSPQQPQSQPLSQPQAPPQQQPYPFGPVPGYPQQQVPPTPVPQQLQPYGAIRPPFNPYQPYGPAAQPNYYGSTPIPTPYNALQPWTNLGANGGPAEQEIQRLRSHIHSLEGELHKLQRKLTKASINNIDTAGVQGGANQDDETRSHRRSKREVVGSTRQTPVIVELNNTTGESIRESSKKHRHRTTSNVSAQQGSQVAQQNSTSAQRPGENQIGSEVLSTNGQNVNQQVADERERSRSGGNQISEGDSKPLPTKNAREETAAQLAHAAAAHVNNRQGFVGGPPPPPPQQQQQQQQPQQQPTNAPLPPPTTQAVRPQVPNQQQQQQQQQQFLYQQGVFPPQGQQIRGPAPRLPGVGNIRFPGDPYRQQQQQQQQFINPQQHNLGNPNYNQSNNNELFDNNDDDNDGERRKQEEEENRSAEKILDAFERFYVNRGNPTTVPMKVKYIPEENNSNSKNSNFYQQNTNNNNRYRSSSRSDDSSSSESKSIYSNSPSSSRRSIYDNSHQKSTIGPFI